MHFDSEADQTPIDKGIDLTYLRRFTLGNRDLEIEVLQLFAEQAPRTLAKLADATEPRAWREAAHTLKGSARAVGAIQVGSVAETAERCAPDSPERPRLMGELQAAVHQALAFIAAEATTR